MHAARAECDRHLEAAAEALHTRRFADAEAALAAARDAASRCPDGDPRGAVVLHHLGILRGMQTRYGDAATALEAAVGAWEQALGPDDPHLCGSLNALAQVHAHCDRPDRAIPLFERCLALWERFRGPAHPVVATSLHNLATQYAAVARHADAVPLFERALRIDEATRGPEHPSVADTLDACAASLAALGRETAALALAERARSLRRIALDASGGAAGSDHGHGHGHGHDVAG